MLNEDQNKRPFILNQLVRATTEEALEGTDDVKLITPATAKVIAGTGGRNVFRSGGTPGSFTATIDTNTFTIDNMSNSKDVDLVFNNLLLVGGGVDYQIDKTTGIVTLEFPIKTGETIHYDVFSTSFSYNDLADIPKDVTTPEFVENKIAELVGSVPETLDTLKELGDALGNDPNFATTITTKLGELSTQDTDLSKQITEVQGKIDNINVTTDMEDVVNSRVNNDTSKPLNVIISEVSDNAKTGIISAISTLTNHVTSKTTEIVNHVTNKISTLPQKSVWSDARGTKLDNLNQSITTTQTNINNNTNIVRDNIKSHMTTEVNRVVSQSTQITDTGLSIVELKADTQADIINLTNTNGGEVIIRLLNGTLYAGQLYNVWINNKLVIDEEELASIMKDIEFKFKGNIRIQWMGSITNSTFAKFVVSWIKY